MKVTIAICTWNRSQLLAQTLQGMTECRHPDGVDWSILVVNNSCDEATDEVCRQFAARLPLRSIREPQPGVSNARNTVIDNVPSGYIVWADDDVLVSKGWLVGFVECARRFPEADVFAGPIEPWFPHTPDPLLAQAFPLLATGFCGTPPDFPAGPCGDDAPIFGANMGFRRTALADLRFDPHLGPTGQFQGGNDEAPVIAAIRRRNGTVVWCPEMTVKHYVDPGRMTLAYLRQFYTDRTRSYVRRFGLAPGSQMLGAPRWAWRTLLETGARYHLLRITPFRLSALVALREYCRAKGVVLEARALARETR